MRSLIEQERYLVGLHAIERLDDRGVLEWQAVAGAASARVLAEFPDAKPNPRVEVEQLLPDGTPYKAVWSLLKVSGRVKLVTVHFFDR